MTRARYRRLTAADIPAMVDVQVDSEQVLQGEEWVVGHHRMLRDRCAAVYAKAMARPADVFIGLEKGTTLLGFFSFDTSDGLGGLHSLYLRCAEKRKKHGRGLFRLALCLARRAGASKMMWQSSRNKGVLEFYHAVGRPYGVQVDDPNNLIMSCSTRALPLQQRRPIKAAL